MRIGIDVAKAVPPRDGIGNYIFHLVDALMRIDDVNEYFLYDLLSPVPEEELLRALPGAPANFRFRAGARPEQDALDLFHSTAWVAPRSVPEILVTCYDLTFLTHPRFHEAHNKLLCIEAMLEAVLGGARFLAISEATARALRDEMQVEPARIEVIPPAVAEGFQPAPAHEARERLRERFAIERPYVLSVGTIEPRKNQLRLARAFEALPGEVLGDHELLLAGGAGWLNSELYRHLEEHGGSSRVRVLGYVEDQDLIDLYNACALFAYPSLAEGFGLPVLEALSCGAAVVTSSTTSLPEAAGDAALLVDPESEAEIAEAIARLLTEPALVADLRAKALVQAGRFSWRRTAEAVRELYLRV